MISRSDQLIRENALEIARELQQAGHSAYWVGGCVRDVLLGRPPDDFDIATSARPEEMEALFLRTIPVGRQFGVLLVVRKGHSFQVATFRAESDYTDGRRPGQIKFSSAKADALRRDFTINGLFFDPINNTLHDWVGGEADLKAKVIRTIGNPSERFEEDHLRLLRAVRLAAQLEFEIEAKTFAAVQEKAGLIPRVSAERVRDELVKLFQAPHAARGLDLLRLSGLLPHLLPEIAATEQCDQSPDYHPEGTVYNHLLKMLDQLPPNPDPSLPWAVLLHDIAKPVTAARNEQTGRIHFYEHERKGAVMAEEILRRLRFPRKQISDIVTCVRYHMQFKDVKAMRKSTLRRLLLRPTFPLELELHRLDCLGSHGQLENYHYLLEHLKELKAKPELIPPLLRGQHLIKLGIPPGPNLGKLLEEAREKQLQGELRTTQEAQDWVRSRISAMRPWPNDSADAGDNP
jgi:poly(A) polymerase